MFKKMVAIFLLFSLLSAFLAGCAILDSSKKTNTSSGDMETNTDNVHTNNISIGKDNIMALGLGCSGEYGYYQIRGSIIYFFDYKTNKTIVLCNKPNCEHKDARCNGYIVAGVNDDAPSSQIASSANYIFYKDGAIHLFCADGNVLKMNFDGTEHQVIATIDSKYGYNRAYMKDDNIYINVYYPEEENHSIVEKSSFVVFDTNTYTWYQTKSYDRNADTLLGVWENEAFYFHANELPAMGSGVSFEQSVEIENKNPCAIYKINLKNGEKSVLRETTEGNMSPAVMLNGMIYYHSRNDETICCMDPETAESTILKKGIGGKIVFDESIDEYLVFLRSKKITSDYDPNNDVMEMFNTETKELMEAYRLQTNIGWNDGFRGILATTPDSYIMIYKADFVVEEEPGMAEPSVVDMKPYVGIIKKKDFWNRNYNFTEITWF